MFQFKIKLRGISKPTVWRRVLVPENYTFLDLHYIIQTVFGWQNCHLFQFAEDIYKNNMKVIALPYEDNIFGENEHIIDASKTELSTIFYEEGRQYAYVYDFGDDWIHDITLEKITDDEYEFPKCIGGKSYTPPENCGGVPGYEMLKHRALYGPHDKEFRDMLKFFDIYEYELFDSRAINKGEMKMSDDVLVKIFTELHKKK